MTEQEIRSSTKPMLTCHDIAKCVGIANTRIRAQAQKDASKLGFPVCAAGNSVRIPRRAFIAWLDGNLVEKHEEGANA